MRTHISEIEKARKDSNRTDVGFLKDPRNRYSLFDVAESMRKTGTKGLDLTAIGNCFICDPDWCPDYKKRLCNGNQIAGCK